MSLWGTDGCCPASPSESPGETDSSVSGVLAVTSGVVVSSCAHATPTIARAPPTPILVAYLRKFLRSFSLVNSITGSPSNSSFSFSAKVPFVCRPRACRSGARAAQPPYWSCKRGSEPSDVRIGWFSNFRPSGQMESTTATEVGCSRPAPGSIVTSAPEKSPNLRSSLTVAVPPEDSKVPPLVMTAPSLIHS